MILIESVNFNLNKVLSQQSMGPSQSAQKQPNFAELFPNSLDFIPKSHNLQGVEHPMPLYQHITSGKLAQVRNFHFLSSRTNSVEQYYYSRSKLDKSPYIFQLIDVKVMSSSHGNNVQKNNDLSSHLCTMRSNKTQAKMERKSLWLLVEASTICLQDQILNRKNKKPFEEIELWSVLSSSVLGAIILLQNGCKEPVLSPRGISLSRDGIIKVSQWEFVSKVSEKSQIEQGEVIFQKLGQPTHENMDSSLNQLLLSYYWAPEGLKAIEKFIGLGKKESNSLLNKFGQNGLTTNKFQIFSLGMTLISMCLRNFYYRTDTFSQKYLSKLTHQAAQIRKVEGKELSTDLKFIIQSMVKWDVQERISYVELRDLILQYLSKHGEEMRSSGASIKTFENGSQAENFSHKSTHKSKKRSASQSQNLYAYSKSGNTSYMEANSFTLAEAQANLAYVQANNQTNHGGSSFVHEGSGMVEQGTGDDDDNLRQEEYQDISSSPVTHRTQKSGREINAPPVTPNMAPSPTINKNKQKSPRICRSPYQQINSQERTETEPIWAKSNKVYLQDGELEKPKSKTASQTNLSLKITIPEEQVQAVEHSVPSSATNRGSYRSFNKDPPNIKSARFDSYSKNAENSFLNINQYSGLFLNQRKIKKESHIHFRNDFPHQVQQLAKDDEDQTDRLPLYEQFFNGADLSQSELQNPDIFQTFVQDYQSMASIRDSVGFAESNRITNAFSKLQKYEPTSSPKRKPSGPEINLHQNNVGQFDDRSQNNYEYMTFNENSNMIQKNLKDKSEEFIPSKWKKPDYKNDGSNLFTDPKLLQYIKSPIQPIRNSPSQDTYKMNIKQQVNANLSAYEGPIGKQNLKGSLNKVKTSQENRCDDKSPIHFMKQSLQSQDFTYQNPHLSKIVKQKVSKGFYEGEKKNGLRSGYGVFYYNEGGKYRGNWLNNKMHGKGTLEYADGRIAYQGDWCCDELHGKGVLYNQSPNFINSALNYEDLDELDQCWIFYEGGFEHDDKSGMGLLVLSNQEQFIGEFKNDMADGMGEYLKQDGSTVKGIWKKNKLVRTIQA